MEELNRRLEKLGALIKSARIPLLHSFDHHSFVSDLKNGRSLSARKPVTRGKPLKVGKTQPLFHSSMLTNSPYQPK